MAIRGDTYLGRYSPGNFGPKKPDEPGISWKDQERPDCEWFSSTGSASVVRLLSAGASKPSLGLGKSYKFYSPGEISSLLLFFKIDIGFYFKYLFFNPTLNSIHYPWNGK